MDGEKLGRLLEDEALARLLQRQEPETLRRLSAHSIELALSTAGMDHLQFAQQLDAIRQGQPVPGRSSLRTQAEEFDAIADEAADSGEPLHRAADSPDPLFLAARSLCAMCEASDPTRDPLDSAAWCLYEVSFVVGQANLRQQLASWLQPA
ncbi:hypothetical protein [Deinococcus aquaedulcis]|uniref:hypothetical protein n=1 Tax=Deinococcus aquaedulcis TaxID=2840455 RepID=UPI001C832F00|nr:hypothetical protein [Deinococcus aquaedulcis]